MSDDIDPAGICDACGEPWIDHPGIVETCRRLLAAEKVVAAAREFGAWLDAPATNGGVNLDHVSDEVVDAFTNCELALEEYNRQKI